MKTNDPRYQAFSRFAEADGTCLDFPACCRLLRVLPGELNELLLDELGVSAEEILLRG